MLRSLVVWAATLTVASGTAGTCEGDEVCLFQTSVTKHKHHMTDIHEVLDAAEKEGPMALDTLVRGVMTLPVTPTEEAMRAAVHASPELRHITQNFPHLLSSTRIFEDPRTIDSIKAAVSEFRNPVKSPVLLDMGKKKTAGQSTRDCDTTVMSWVSGWGCKTNVSFIEQCVTAEGADPSKLIKTFPLFGPSCDETNHPYATSVTFDAETKSAFAVKQVHGKDAAGDWRTTYTIGWSNGTFYDLGDLPVPKDQWLQGSFNTATDSFDYVLTTGKYPNYTYFLIRATKKGLDNLMNFTSADCQHPGQITPVSDSGDVVWVCYKDYRDKESTNKIVKYHAGEVSVMSENKEYYGYVTTFGNDVVYSQYENSSYTLYSCVPPAATPDESLPCEPSKLGVMAQGTSWKFTFTDHGDLVTSQYLNWDSVKRVSNYGVNVSAHFGEGVSHRLFTVGGYVEHMQIQLLKVDPLDPDELDGDKKEGVDDESIHPGMMRESAEVLKREAERLEQGADRPANPK